MYANVDTIGDEQNDVFFPDDDSNGRRLVERHFANL